jgi:hypothetical protein
MAVSDAINAPGGGDYAKAIAILRRSNWPPAVKSAKIGWLIIGSFDDPAAKRGSESLQDGLELVESATMQSGETRGYTPQHLRMLFERGSGVAPNNIPVDPAIASCWRKLENGGVGDPARCITLRRERLPRVGS